MPAVAFHTAPLTSRAGGVGNHAWDQQRRWTKKQRWRQPEDEDEEDEAGSSGGAAKRRPPPPLMRTDPKSAAAAADAQRYLASAPPRGLELVQVQEAQEQQGGADRAPAAAPALAPTPPPPLPPGSPSRHPYASFATQRRAFEFWDAQPLRAHLRCFAIEHARPQQEPEEGPAREAAAAPPPPGHGSRSFLVTTDERLWREYRSLPARGRHHYEIIREGRPCHLYFDLERYFCQPRGAAAAASAGGGSDDGPRPHPPPSSSSSSSPAAIAEAAATAAATVDGGRLVELLLDEVELALRDLFGGGGGEEAGSGAEAAPQPPAQPPLPPVDRARDVIELDSTRPPPPDGSAPGKFSRHLIVRLPGGAMFADNAHAGAFVRLVCARLLAKASAEGRSGAEHAGFLVAPRADSAAAAAPATAAPFQLFVDTGVYTRNRAFRMYLSSKAPGGGGGAGGGGGGGGPAAAAQPAPPPPSPPALLPTRRYGGVLAVRTPDELFFDALVTRAPGQGGGNKAASAAAVPPRPPPAPLLRLDTSRARELEAAAERDAEPAARLLLTPSISACTPFARVRVPGAVGAAGGGGGGSSSLPSRAASAAASAAHSLAVLHDGPSPYASLLSFLEDAATRLAGAGGSASARTRGWAHAPEARVVLAPFRAPFRWCGNVGRHHRSNGVFAVADLEAGCWYMRCYDPDCAGWRSPALPLPAAVWGEARSAAEREAGGAGGGGEEEEDDDAYYNALLDAVEAGAAGGGGATAEAATAGVGG
jgi:hypothetical protein